MAGEGVDEIIFVLDTRRLRVYDFEQMGDGEPIEKVVVCQPVPEVANYPVACALPSSGYNASEGATGCGKRMTQSRCRWGAADVCLDAR